MNSLPRFLALCLFVMLAALSALLAVPALRHSAPARAPADNIHAAGEPPVVRLAHLAQRASFPLAATSALLALALAASLALGSRSTDRNPVSATQRAEMGALARLAETSVAQGAQLAHERDERQRAQADALLHQQMLNRSLEEKIQLGRDLHDGIIQSLYATGLQIASARSEAATDPAEADRRLAEVLQNLNRTIRDVRAYIDGLAPESLRQTRFVDAMQSLVTELRAGRDTEFEVRIDDDATRRLTMQQSTEILHVAREAISNSLRHGGAAQITIRVTLADTAVNLLIQDNGRGFDARQASGGHGLHNMRARAEAIGGAFHIESTAGAGTRVLVTLPLHRAA